MDAGHYIDPSALTFGAQGPGYSARNLGSSNVDAFMASLRYDPPAVEGLTLKYRFDYTGEDQTPPPIQILEVGSYAYQLYPKPY